MASGFALPTLGYESGLSGVQLPRPRHRLRFGLLLFLPCSMKKPPRFRGSDNERCHAFPHCSKIWRRENRGSPSVSQKSVRHSDQVLSQDGLWSQQDGDIRILAGWTVNFFSALSGEDFFARKCLEKRGSEQPLERTCPPIYVSLRCEATVYLAFSI